MGEAHYRQAVSTTLAVCAVGIFLGLGCAMQPSGGSAPGLSLSSGMDKKQGGTISEQEIGDLSADQQYFMRDSGQAHAEQQAAGTPARPAANGVIDQMLDKAGADAARLNSWLVPAAYAQDHGIDERYLVRSGECTLEVAEYQAAVVELKRIAAVNGGSVTASESARNSDETTEGWVTLRVPSAKFGDTWDAVLAAGKVLRENTRTEDASQQYIGYVSQLKSLVAEQATLQKMLDEALAIQRSRGLGDAYKTLLDTQQRLFDVSAQIQNTEDQLNGLTDQITRSTITVSLKETRKLPAQTAQVTEEFDWGLGGAAAEAYQVLLVRVRGFVQGFVFFIITCWTWLIPWTLFIWLGVWIYRRWLKRLLVAQPKPQATTSNP
jgi:hypothetical protein